MKKLYRIFSIGLLLTLVASCANDDSSTAEALNASGITVSNTQVKDSSGTLLGYLVEASHTQFTILTTTDYLVTLKYDGSPRSDTTTGSYTTNDCTGAVYVSANSSYGKAVVTVGDGNIYLPKTVINGLASSSSITRQSYRTGSSCFTNSLTMDAYELKTTTFQEIGLPTTISAPISFNHQ